MLLCSSCISDASLSCTAVPVRALRWTTPGWTRLDMGFGLHRHLSDAPSDGLVPTISDAEAFNSELDQVPSSDVFPADSADFELPELPELQPSELPRAAASGSRPRCSRPSPLCHHLQLLPAMMPVVQQQLGAAGAQPGHADHLHGERACSNARGCLPWHPW